MKNKKIFIGCSSSKLVDQEYIELARKVAEVFVKLDYDFVFGAASFGMMGNCYEVFHEAMRKVYSFTTAKYEDDLLNLDSYKDKVCSTSFDRTASIYNACDIILFLPGGTGTLAEVFGMLEENRSIDSPKKIIIYNYNGFYDRIIDLIDFCIDKKFNTDDIFTYFEVCNSLEEVIEVIEKWEN